MTLSGTVTASALRTDFDALTSTIQAGDEQDGDFTVPLQVATLSDTDDVSLRSIAFTPTDDYEVRGLYVRATDGTANRVVTATLTVDSGDTSYLLDKTIMANVTTVVGTADSRPTDLDLRTTTGDRIRLVKGVRYRLTLATTDAAVTISGPVDAMLQLRSRSRGADAFVAMVPHRFTDGGNLDGDSVNDNLRAIEADMNRAVARRTTRSFGIIPFSGMDLAEDESSIPLRLHAASPDDGIVIERMEFVIYHTASPFTITFTPSDPRVAPVSLDTAGVTVEATASIERPFPATSDSSDIEITCNSAPVPISNLTHGYAVIHYAHDRHGGTVPAATVTDVDASTADPATSINDALASLATTLASDQANAGHRIEVYAARNFGATSTTYRSPGGKKTGAVTQVWAVGPAAHTIRVAVGGNNVDVNTDGSGNFVYNDGSYTLSVNDDPTDTTDDTQIVISRTAGASDITVVIAVVRWTP